LPFTITLDPEHLPPGVVSADVPAGERGERALHALAAGLVVECGGEKLPVKGVVGTAISTTVAPSGATLVSGRYELDLPAGAESVKLAELAEVGAFVVKAFEIEGPEAPVHWVASGPGGVEIRLAAAVAPPSRWAVVRQYVALGFTHILPKGLDHIGFVLGLFLLSTRWKPLLLQVSAFTVAHTLTLAASIYGAIRLSPALVEPAIALSIAYVAIENLVTSELKPWRPALVFGFGLLHGLGFAGVLSGLGLPRERFLSALLSFNAGVELGQLAVLALAFLLVGWARGRAGYRRFVVVPGSLAIAAVGIYWFVERVLPGP
jgi:hypothetical protein